MTTYDDALNAHDDLLDHLAGISDTLDGRPTAVADFVAVAQVNATNNLALSVLALVEEIHKARSGGPGLPPGNPAPSAQRGRQ